MYALHSFCLWDQSLPATPVRQLLSTGRCQDMVLFSLTGPSQLKLSSRTADSGNPRATCIFSVSPVPLKSGFRCLLSLIRPWRVPDTPGTSTATSTTIHSRFDTWLIIHAVTFLFSVNTSNHPHWSHWDSWQRSKHLLSFSNVSRFKYKFTSENFHCINQMRKRRVWVCEK